MRRTKTQLFVYCCAMQNHRAASIELLLRTGEANSVRADAYEEGRRNLYSQAVLRLQKHLGKPEKRRIQNKPETSPGDDADHGDWINRATHFTKGLGIFIQSFTCTNREFSLYRLRMDNGTLWLNNLSSWMENKGDCLPDDAMGGLSEEWHKTAQETDTLLHCSHRLQMAFSQIIEKYDSGL